MSNYILTASGQLYQYGPGESELYHYGVPGMKWGQRKAAQRDQATSQYQKWQSKANAARGKGRNRRAEKYAQKADEYKSIADKHQSRIDKKINSKYAKVGKAIAAANYKKAQGDKVYKQYDDKAKALEKQAAYEDKHGKSLSALSLRNQATNMRNRGAEARQASINSAKAYMEQSKQLNKKASEFANATNTKMGKNKVDSLIKSSVAKETRKLNNRDALTYDEKVARNQQMDTAYRLAQYRY